MYLKDCIESVKKQNISPKEIICIDDGSTDGSYEYLKNISENDAEIIVLHQENQGAGIARNKALNIAKGKYIAFLDADDLFIDTDALDEMYKLCEENNISVCRALKNFTDGTVYKSEKFYIDILKNDEKSNILSYRDFQDDYDYMCYIYKRELLENYGIKFPPYRRFQDPPFLVRALYNADKIILCNRWLYSYRKPTIASRFEAVKVLDMLKGLMDNLEFAAEHKLDVLLDNTMNRVDYEYFYVIKKYMPQNVEILNILMAIDDISVKKRKKHIRLLEYVCDCIRDDNEAYGKKLCSQIEDSDEIMIYGAGYFGKLFWDYLKRKELWKKVNSFVVTKEPNNTRFMDVKIRTVDDICDRLIPIYIAVAGMAQEEIYENLIEKGYKKVYRLNTFYIEEVMQNG